MRVTGLAGTGDHRVSNAKHKHNRTDRGRATFMGVIRGQPRSDRKGAFRSAPNTVQRVPVALAVR